MTMSLARSLSRGFRAAAASRPRNHGSARFASVLVVSDPLVEDGSLPVATQSAVTAALQWLKATGDTTNDCILLTTGPAGPTSSLEGVTQSVNATTDSKVVETAANAIQQAAEKYSPDLIMGTATKWGSSVIPRAAAMLQKSPLSDVVEIIDAKTFIRPLYAGNALAKVQSTAEGCQIMTIRPTAFDKAPVTDAAETETFEAKDFTKATWKSQSVSSSTSGRPDLTAARIVISGGRGIGSAEQFSVLEALADAFPAGQAAVGASRAAVDAGMAPNDKQVGQTGKVVAPDLYIAVGISGAIQHISGMKDSKTIVAINKDPEAPIFQVADYGLVQDLFVAVPDLTGKVKA
uniref:Electron transfer flavoprotein alpha/beta-subunit N-terminal domain-containing protein n=1 Tax=Amphora coffeiformis TaxID=265554 RepID=A0A7S3LCZ6_9STRA